MQEKESFDQPPERIQNLLAYCGEQMFTKEELIQISFCFLVQVQSEVEQEIASLEEGEEDEMIDISEVTDLIFAATRIDAATTLLADLVPDSDEGDEC